MADQCPFLRFNNSFWGASYTCMRTNKSVYDGSPEYKQYCNTDYTYKKCPYFAPASSSSGCFLTSACVEAQGLTDDCEELTVLRHFRDNWLKKQPYGEEKVREYYRIAPDIVRAIHNSPNAAELLKQLYNDLVVPCVNYIKNGNNDAAYSLYEETTNLLKNRYLSE